MSSYKEDLDLKYEIDSDHNLKQLEIDFDSLSRINSDIVGWIKINNSEIDYSIVQTNNNDFYLTHNFYKEYNGAGWIFADYRNDLYNLDKNTIIYGHNRRNNSMFSTLKNTLDKTWCEKPENQYFVFNTKYERYFTQIFSVIKVDENDSDVKISFTSDNEFEDYINNLKNRSIYDFDTEISKDDKILTLYTCDNNTAYRIIVFAKLIPITQ